MALATAASLAVPLVWIRVAPADVARWHVDPMEVERVPQAPRRGGWLLRTGPANAAPPVFDTDPATLLSAFDEIARATPRTRVLFESPAEGRVTYVSRSAVLGFPDYTSVKAVPEAGGAALMIWARQRFGVADMGVNRMRVEAWMAALEDRLPRR
ncbi:DUF1499 domain-containing protein [Limimaricola sp. G21655-S1]|uniref:DUF1499 domain-containing protein n=1 Tax=Limimaricola sp. G21655-S1 TaxID=3014768 RepID=UPI0022AF1559|nr:DUF1499 domain-containing protein [Limimaricola sp. G21655-S1]MCZ4261194.1 DUF1499 domain-containing protein [Limimaricola sp. G21655-S1]